MPSLGTLLTARRGRGRFDWTDWVSYGYLGVGLVLMFGPVLWLVLSSFKTGAALNEFPPQLLPYGQAVVSGRVSQPAAAFRVKLPDGQDRVMAKRPHGIIATMVTRSRRAKEVKVTSRIASLCGSPLGNRELHRRLLQSFRSLPVEYRHHRHRHADPVLLNAMRPSRVEVQIRGAEVVVPPYISTCDSADNHSRSNFLFLAELVLLNPRGA